MSLLSAMRQKRELKQSATDSGECRSIPLANANPANFANPSKGTIPPLARLATLALASPRETKPAIVGADTTAAPFDDELFQERAAIYEFDASFTREEAERRAMKEVTTWVH